MIETFLEKVQRGADLTEEESREAILHIMQGKFSADQVKTFLLALREKGEALSEVIGAARAMREQAVPLKLSRPAVDTCGTGGDGLKTLNISTVTALVVAGAGVAVAKHGNRSVTSACGSADLLEALGVKVDVEPAVVERCIQDAGFGFLFAPRFHPAMRAVASIRRELGVPTIFNLLGPLTNPAGVRRQLVGVADAAKLDLYAQALEALGAEKGLVVRGEDGQDELSVTGPTEVRELGVVGVQSRILPYQVTPEQFGLPRASLQDLVGGSVEENTRLARRVLTGDRGPIRDAVLLNAAAVLYVAGEAGGIRNGLILAADAIDSGTAAAVLEKVAKMTHD